MQKDRGQFLIVSIALNFVYYLFLGYLTLMVLTHANAEAISVGFMLSIIFIILKLMSLFGLWQMKKWGVYLFGVSFAYDLIPAIMKFSTSASTSILDFRPSINFTLIFGILLAIAIFRKWKTFE